MFLGACLKNTNGVTLCQNSVFEKFSGGFRKLHFWFCLFYVGDREAEKKWKKTKKTDNIVLLKVVIQKWEECKKWLLSKHCLTLSVSGREKQAHFRDYLFGPKIVFGPGQTIIKIVVSAEIVQNQKMTHFCWKRCFLTWVRKWVLLTVVLKSCVLLKTRFSSVFRKHIKKMYVDKNLFLFIWVWKVKVVFVVLVCVFCSLFRFCFCLFWLYFCFVVGLLLVLFLFCFFVFLVFLRV